MNENVLPLNTTEAIPIERYQTYEGLDEALGGGIVRGSVVLLAGIPGVGKSTLLLQIAKQLAERGLTVLYVLGEENFSQVRDRANRLHISSPKIFCTEKLVVEDIQDIATTINADFIIVDSLQTITSSAYKQMAGTPTQIRAASSLLTQFIKKTNRTLFFVGHSTKTGIVAGAQTLQHMVDVVLFMTADANSAVRVMQVKKNRYGSSFVNWFASMNEEGLHDLGLKDGKESYTSPSGLVFVINGLGMFSALLFKIIFGLGGLLWQLIPKKNIA